MDFSTQYSWLTILPVLFFLLFYGVALFVYFPNPRERWARLRRIFSLKRLIYATLGVRIAYAITLTVMQYRIWADGGIGAFFLRESLSSSLPIPIIQKLSWIFSSQRGYFIFYVFERFWLSALLSIFVAWIFYQFLILLKKYNARFFEEGDVELGFFSALIAGWPLFVIFVPLVFLCVILLSLIRALVFREAYTTLRWAFLVATGASLFLGAGLISKLGLSVLRV